MDMRNLEADNEPEAEAGYADECVTDNVDHGYPPLCLLFQFIHERDYRVGVRAFLCQTNEPVGIIHNQQLVSGDNPDSKGDNPDTNIDQQICEHISHSASYCQLRGLPDKFIEYDLSYRQPMPGVNR
jgi:hypothetical protein